jgi:hypothetical protein
MPKTVGKRTGAESSASSWWSGWGTEEVWKDPYVTGKKRQKTDMEMMEFSVAWEAVPQRWSDDTVKTNLTVIAILLDFVDDPRARALVQEGMNHNHDLRAAV